MLLKLSVLVSPSNCFQAEKKTEPSHHRWRWWMVQVERWDELRDLCMIEVVYCTWIKGLGPWLESVQLLRCFYIFLFVCFLELSGLEVGTHTFSPWCVHGLLINMCKWSSAGTEWSEQKVAKWPRFDVKASCMADTLTYGTDSTGVTNNINYIFILISYVSFRLWFCVRLLTGLLDFNGGEPSLESWVTPVLFLLSPITNMEER